MSSFQIYQVEPFLFEAIRADLETATDVLYDIYSFNDKFNDGSTSIACLTSSWDQEAFSDTYSGWTVDKKYSPTVFVHIGSLVQHVRKQLEKTKSYEYEFSQLDTYDLGGLNKWIKRHGIMYQISKKAFIKYKKPKPRIKKVDLLRLSYLRLDCCLVINQLIIKHFNTGICTKHLNTKVVQNGIVKIGKKLNITYKEICEYNGEGYNLEPFTKTFFESKRQELARTLTPEQSKETLKEFEKWFNEC